MRQRAQVGRSEREEDTRFDWSQEGEIQVTKAPDGFAARKAQQEAAANALPLTVRETPAES